jgi:hypothetical protein
MALFLLIGLFAKAFTLKIRVLVGMFIVGVLLYLYLT